MKSRMFGRAIAPFCPQSGRMPPKCRSRAASDGRAPRQPVALTPGGRGQGSQSARSLRRISLTSLPWVTARTPWRPPNDGDLRTFHYLVRSLARDIKRNIAVGIAVHDQRWKVELGEVLPEVRGGEGVQTPDGRLWGRRMRRCPDQGSRVASLTSSPSSGVLKNIVVNPSRNPMRSLRRSTARSAII